MHLLPVGATYRSAGVAVYVDQLVHRLPQVDPGNDYVFFGPTGVEVTGVIQSRLPTTRPPVRVLWEQIAAPWLARRLSIDVWHSPVNVAPLLLGRRSVITVHDLSFLVHPDRFLPAKRMYLTAFTRASLRQASEVIAVSHATKKDLMAYLGLPDERVSVVPLGVDERYRPRPDLPSPLPDPYILYVGTIEPRKNLDILVRAFAALKRAGYPHVLALVGARGWLYAHLFRLIASLGLEDVVVQPGFVDDLVPWYNCADLFVYPSHYEGFGLPPLEAMACGTPVVTTWGGALGEVVGDAALTVAPGDESALRNAIQAVLGRESLAASLVVAGYARAAGFSWDRTARDTATVYRRVAGNRRTRSGG